MMSMSMYHRPRKSKRTTQVRRSVSLPNDLPEVAQDFMNVVISSSSKQKRESFCSIPEDEEARQENAISSLGYGSHSCREEDDDFFFLPMDTDLESTPEEPLNHGESRQLSTSKQHVVKSLEQQQHRNEAMAKLEEFFLGESTTFITDSKTSPISVLDFKDAPEPTASNIPQAQTSSPKRNLFGHVMEDPAMMEPSLPPSRPEMEEVQAASTHEFAMLRIDDRAFSLPNECISRSESSKTLRRKSSIKKISSIGNFQRQDSDSSMMKRNVSFSSLQIREYNIAPSDHPSCSFGPPVQLSWDYQEKGEVPVESYEESREPRRSTMDLLLSYYDRRFMLLKQAGYSKKEVKAAMKEAERVKKERTMTELFLPASPLDETMENVVDAVKKFFTK